MPPYLVPVLYLHIYIALGVQGMLFAYNVRRTACPVWYLLASSTPYHLHTYDAYYSLPTVFTAPR